MAGINKRETKQMLEHQDSQIGRLIEAEDECMHVHLTLIGRDGRNGEKGEPGAPGTPGRPGTHRI